MGENTCSIMFGQPIIRTDFSKQIFRNREMITTHEKYKCERVERPRPSFQVSGPLPASTGNPNFIGRQIGGEKKRRATENEKSALGKYQIEFGMPR